MALRIAYVTSGMGHTGTAICQALHRAGHRVAGCGPKSRKDHWLKAQKALGYDDDLPGDAGGGGRSACFPWSAASAEPARP